jgi:hypothetical protein
MKDWLIATTVHSGNHYYAVDSRTLYDELKPLVINSPGWSLIKHCSYNNKTKDSRKAVLALKKQAKGQATKLNRKTKAHAVINQSVSYCRPCHGIASNTYIALNQQAHNKLLDLQEPVLE